MGISAQDWPRDALPKGTNLNGYHLAQVIGRGGFGITYRATDGIDQVFAVKECFPRQFCTRLGNDVFPGDAREAEPFADCLERFTQEARAQRQLSTIGAAGDGVVKVVTYFQANGTAYIVMEYVAGQSLDSLIKANPKGLSEDRIQFILPRLLHAIGCVHNAGLLHRDIKPANILLREDGRPVLIDFGATRGLSLGRTLTFTQIFSEGYAPIEQFAGVKQGPFSDIYALGATFYRAIGGTAVDSFTRNQAVLRGKRDPQIPASEIGAGRYSPVLLNVIDRAMIVSPEDRPQSVNILLAQLGQDEMLTVIQPSVALPRPVIEHPPEDLPPVPDQPLLTVAVPDTVIAPSKIVLEAQQRRVSWLRIGTAAAILLGLLGAILGGVAVFQRDMQYREQEAATSMPRATQAQTAARAVLSRTKTEIAGLGYSPDNAVPHEAEALMTKAETELAHGTADAAADNFDQAAALISKSTRAFLDQQISTQVQLAQIKSVIGEPDSVQILLQSAKQTKQTEYDLGIGGDKIVPETMVLSPAAQRAAASRNSARDMLDRTKSTLAELGLSPGTILADATAGLTRADRAVVDAEFDVAANEYGKVSTLTGQAMRAFLEEQVVIDYDLSKTKLADGDLTGAQDALSLAKKIKSAEAAFQ